MSINSWDLLWTTAQMQHEQTINRKPDNPLTPTPWMIQIAGNYSQVQYGEIKD